MSIYPTARLGDLIAGAKSGFACGDEDPNGIFQMRMNNITRSGRLDLTRKRYVPRDGAAIPASILSPGDVLFNATNSPDLVGKTLYFPGLEEPTAFSNHFIRLRVKSESLDPKFLARWLHAQFKSGVFKSMCRQWVNQATVGREALLGLNISLPPVKVQQRIATVLDQVDELRAKRREAIALLDDLVQSTFLGMFGDSGAEWPRVTVADLVKGEKGAIRTGPFGSQLLHEEFVESGVAVLGIDNAVDNEFKWQGRRYITHEKYAQLARYTVHPGDVLITIMGTCGRCAVVPDDIPLAINTKHLCCITLDKSHCLPEFLHSYFLIHPKSRDYLGRNAKGAIMAGLNMGIVKDLPVDLPPVDMQNAFVNRVQAIRHLKAEQERHLDTLNAIFDSVQQRAFRGELWADTSAA